jgi:DNA primase
MDFVEHLKSSVDIVAVIGEYVRLRRVGAGPRYMGLCPFHSEKTASFSVHSGHQFYKCFGCSAGGDVIKFVMEMERLSFWEAIQHLAERNGIPLPKRNDLADDEAKRRTRILDIHVLAAQHFSRTLNSSAGSEARQYVDRRGVRSEISEEFALGYAERGGQSLVRFLERQGFTSLELEESGLVIKRSDGSGFFDRFRHRLMFPIHSESGKVIAFGGRALAPDDEPKYLNSPETSIYRKGHILYNLNRARKAIQQESYVIMVEGYMDVIGVYAAGVHNVVATCGTALTQQQVASLRRHAPEVVVNFDPDKAGRSATERSIDIVLNERMQVRVLELPEGVDPDEYILANSAAAYVDLVKNHTRRYFHWLADRARGKFDMRTPEGRVQVFQLLLPQIHKMPERLDRLEVVNDLADHLRVEPSVVLDEFRRAAAERREARPAPVAKSPLGISERQLLRAILENDVARAQLPPRLRQAGVHKTFLSAKIFETMLRMIEDGAPFSYTTVEARLEDSDKELLAKAVLDDEEVQETPTIEQAAACLERLERDAQKSGAADLRERIKAAERAGDFAEALRLTAEFRDRKSKPE